MEVYSKNGFIKKTSDSNRETNKFCTKPEFNREEKIKIADSVSIPQDIADRLSNDKKLYAVTKSDTRIVDSHKRGHRSGSGKSRKKCVSFVTVSVLYCSQT